MKRKILLPVLLQLGFIGTVFSQDKWDLQRCVEYAWANNITIKQSKIQAELAEVDLKQSQWSQYPSLDFSTSTGMQWGRSIDRTTNTYTTVSSLYQSFSASAGITVFNWNRIKNNILASRYANDAAGMDVEKAKNDVALNVATYYLQVLLARQQMDIAKVQMAQTMSQIQFTRKKVEAGAVPELDALTLEGQYATDSSNYITAVSNVDQAVLTLKIALNLDAGAVFDITSPPVEQIPVEPILQLQPQAVFDIAMKSQPAQKANELRIQSLATSVKSSKSLLYPTISVGGSLGTNFNNPTKSYRQFINGVDTIARADAGSVQYPVYIPTTGTVSSKKSFSEIWDGWGTQINGNFGQGLGVTLSVPILSGGQARFNYQRSKLNLKNAQVTKELTDQTLKNDIYKAYYSASAAMQKFNASKTSVEITQKTYDFAVKRYELGLLNTFDLLTSQNNLTRAKLDRASAQFDYVFKMKVLEFYKGQGIKLSN
ncbi:TolC family protein [Pseudoflavitalea sp. X16]|uniref:TolC family protein n=1 Tax=Paraflavitalea devenefica TaxID=2716334 RepID=UPI00141EAAC6|nr:TolC family protein [Paraflavitalea devenefica]NII23954.1 TolC family protein [Paraflavitalea devenefica]